MTSSTPADGSTGAVGRIATTIRPRSVAVVLRDLADLQARYKQQRAALVGGLAGLDQDLLGTLDAIADPVEQAVAATRALDVESALRTARDGAIGELAQPHHDGGRGVPGAEIARRLGYSRQLVFDILGRQPADHATTRPVDPVVERLAAVDDPWVRAESAGLALAAHRRRKAALVQRQRAAIRRAVTEQHISRAALARRLGKDPSWIGVLVGTKGQPGRHRASHGSPAG